MHCVNAISSNEIIISDTSLSKTLKTVTVFTEELSDSDVSDECYISDLELHDWVIVNINYKSVHYPGCITQLNGGRN